MIALLFGVLLFVLAIALLWQTAVLAAHLIWLACLLVAWCVRAAITAVLAVAIVAQWVHERLRRPKVEVLDGEILPPQRALLNRPCLH
jgi:hypothetical protein